MKTEAIINFGRKAKVNLSVAYGTVLDVHIGYTSSYGSKPTLVLYRVYTHIHLFKPFEQDKTMTGAGLKGLGNHPGSSSRSLDLFLPTSGLLAKVRDLIPVKNARLTTDRC